MAASPIHHVTARLASVAFAAWWLLAATACGQGTYVWNTGSGNWDTTTANWTGEFSSTWLNGGSSNAVFNTNTGSITLTEAITAGVFTFGLTNANSAGAFTGASLVIEDTLTAQADGNNGPGGPTLSFSNDVTVGGDVRLSRRVLEITGGTFTANRLISVDSWGRLLVSGGTVAMTNGIDDSVAGNTLSVFLQGGSLYTPYINTTSAGWTTVGNDGVVLNGGTLYATANSNDFLRTRDFSGWGNRNNVGVGTGGANINTNGFDITITKSMGNYGSAGVLTKSGAGTLTLTGQSNYSGGTTVNQGMLVLANNAWNLNSGGGGGVTVGNGATLRADNSIANQLNGLTLNGGTVDAINNPGNGDWGNFFLTGNVTASGSSNLNAEVALRATNVDFNVANGGTLNVGGVMHNGAYFGIYSGSPATVSKSGAGTMVLSGANTYTGATTVSAGTLTYQNTYASPAHAVASGAVLDFNVASDSRDSATTTFSGSGTLRKTGAGELRWGTSTATFALSPGALIDVQGGFFVAGSNANENWSSNQSDLNVASGAEFSTVEANVRVNAITGTGTIRTGYPGAGYQNLTIGVSNGSGTFSGVIADAVTRGNLVKSGTGTVTLSGANTYSGQTDITAGTLVAANNTALGPGGHDGNTMSFIRDGATLALQGGVSLDEHFHVWGVGAGGLGAVRSISGNNALTNSPGGGAGFALRTNTTVGVDADTLTVSGFYEEGGNWGLTKVGAGTLQLTAESSYTGGTVVNAGRLLLPGNGGRGRIGGVLTVNAGGTVETTGDGTGLGYQDQISSVSINGGTVTTTGTMHVWNISGGVTMTGGTLQSNDGVSNSGGNQLEWNRTSVTTNASGSTATIGGRIRMRADGGYSGISFTVADGAAATDLLISAAITEASGGMGITKSGAGTMALSGYNTYSGVTTLEGGVINAATFANNGSASSLGVGTGDTNVEAIGLLFRGGTLRYTGPTAQSTNRAIRLSTIGGGGTLDASGSAAEASLSFTASSSPNLFEGPGSRTLTLTGSNTGANTFAMAIGEAGGTTALVKSGAGRWVLTGASTYTGGTNVTAGTLVVNGSLGGTTVSVASAATLGGSGTIGGPVSILAGGILAPGTSPGTLTVTNTLALDSASLLNFEVNAADTTVGGGINDLITGVTDLTLDGTLNLSGAGDFLSLTAGTAWRLFDYSGSLTDNALTIGSAPTLAAGLSFVVDTSTPNQVNLSVVPEPGPLLLAALGLAGAGWLARCRRHPRRTVIGEDQGR